MSKALTMATKKDVRVGVIIGGKKTVHSVDIPLASNWSDLRKLMAGPVKGASLADPDNFAFKIEMQIESAFVDVSTEENFLKIKDKMKLMTQLRVNCTAKVASDGAAAATGSSSAASMGAENVIGNASGNGRSKTPTPFGSRSVLGGLAVSSSGALTPSAAAASAASRSKSGGAGANRRGSVLQSSAAAASATSKLSTTPVRVRKGSVAKPNAAPAPAPEVAPMARTVHVEQLPVPTSGPAAAAGLVDTATATATATSTFSPVLPCPPDSAAAPNLPPRPPSICTAPMPAMPAMQRQSSFSPTFRYANISPLTADGAGNSRRSSFSEVERVSPRANGCSSTSSSAATLTGESEAELGVIDLDHLGDADTRSRSISIDTLRRMSSSSPRVSLGVLAASTPRSSIGSITEADAAAPFLSPGASVFSPDVGRQRRGSSLDLGAVARSRSSTQSLVQPIVIDDTYRDGLLLCPTVTREGSIAPSSNRTSLDNNAPTPVTCNSSPRTSIGSRRGSMVLKLEEDLAENDDDVDPEVEQATQMVQESCNIGSCLSPEGGAEEEFVPAPLIRRDTGFAGHVIKTKPIEIPSILSPRSGIAGAKDGADAAPDEDEDEDFGEYDEEEDDFKSWGEGGAELDSDVDEVDIDAIVRSNRAGSRASSLGGTGSSGSKSTRSRRNSSSSSHGSGGRSRRSSRTIRRSSMEPDASPNAVLADAMAENLTFSTPRSSPAVASSRHSGLFFPATPVPVPAVEDADAATAVQLDAAPAVPVASRAPPAPLAAPAPAPVSVVAAPNPVSVQGPAAKVACTLPKAEEALVTAQDSDSKENCSPNAIAEEASVEATAAEDLAVPAPDSNTDAHSDNGTTATTAEGSSSAGTFSMGKRCTAAGVSPTPGMRRNSTHFSQISKQSYAMSTVSASIRRKEKEAALAAVAAAASAARAAAAAAGAEENGANKNVKKVGKTPTRKSVLTAGELNARFMNNIRVVDYDKVATGAVRKTIKEEAEASNAVAARDAAAAAFSGSKGGAGQSTTPTRTRNFAAAVGKPRAVSNVRLAYIANSGGGPSVGGGKRGRGGGGSDCDDDVIDGHEPVFSRAKSSKKQRGRGSGDGASGEGEGRLSIETLRRQLEIMKKVSGMSPEDIEWAGVKDNDGAYKYANNKHMRAEDDYFRSMWEAEHYGALKKVLHAGSGCKLNNLLTSIMTSQEVFTVTPYDPVEVAKIVKERKELEELLMSPQFALRSAAAASSASSSSRDSASAPALKSTANNTILSDTMYKALVDMINDCKEAKDMPRKAKMIKEKYFAAECKLITDKCIAADKLNAKSMTDMEMWEKRKVATKEYASVVAAEERAWMEAESEANNAALATMRTYLTPAIIGTTYAEVSAPPLSAAELMEFASASGGLYSYELVQELKNNKCLHWIVKHLDDIANSSFLIGDSKACFENLDGMDLIELRALVTVLFPLNKFKVDNDGKKWEWRNQLFAKCKSLIDQANGVEVKGGWDGKSNKRAMVKLPPLQPEKRRRSVYYYRTAAQFNAKLKQYNDRRANLARKEAALVAAEAAKDDAAAEWNTLLKELRDDGCQESVSQLSKEDINALKKEALFAKTGTEKAYKALVGEVAQMRKTIRDNPISRDTFIEHKEQLEAFLLTKGEGIVYEDAKEPILIEGVFDSNCEINKAVVTGTVAKFLSGADEQKRRQLEMDAMMVRKTAGTSSGGSGNSSGASSMAHSMAPSPVPDVDGNGQVVEGSVTPANEGTTPLLSPVAINGAAAGAGEARTPGGRRASVLNNLPPSMLNTLNNTFAKISGQQDNESNATNTGSFSRSTTPGRRPAAAIGAASSSSGENTEGGASSPVRTASTSPVPSKPVQSKLLKRMMSVLQDPEAANAAPTASLTPQKPALNFLDQLKARGGGGGSSTPAGAPALSFLDQLKVKRGGGDASASLAPSFLDQIKAKRVGGEGDDVGTTPLASPKPPAMGLFEAIRARKAKEEDDA